jgi:excisionase family DNA binding protein
MAKHSPRTPPHPNEDYFRAFGSNRLYSLQDACAAWGISLRTIESHIHDGHIPIVRRGKLRRISSPVFERLSRDGLPPNGSGRKPAARRG